MLAPRADMPTLLHLVLALALGDPAPPAPAAVQLATAPPRRTRPPLDPAALQLRQARGILAGGVVLTAVCGVGFGLATWAAVDARDRLSGASGGRVIAAAGVLLACTVASIAGIGVGAHRLRALRPTRRVAWSGGLGLRF